MVGYAPGMADAVDPAGGDPARAPELVVVCACGVEIRGPESQLIPAVQQHGRDAHNMDATPEQVLAMARPA
jgi:predicted small metal-binding protein